MLPNRNMAGNKKAIYPRWVNGTGRNLIDGCFTHGEILILMESVYQISIPASIGAVERKIWYVERLWTDSVYQGNIIFQPAVKLLILLQIHYDYIYYVGGGEVQVHFAFAEISTNRGVACHGPYLIACTI